MGDTTAQKILASTNIDPAKRTYQLAEEELASIRDELENYTTEGDLRRMVSMNIKRCFFIVSEYAQPSLHYNVVLSSEQDLTRIVGFKHERVLYPDRVMSTQLDSRC